MTSIQRPSRTARTLFRLRDLLAVPTGVGAAARAAVLAGLCLTAIVALQSATGIGHLASSLGSTVIVAFLLPDSAFARPRVILAGHAVSSLTGWAVAALLGPSPWAAALAVGLSIVVMQALHCMQPPAGGDPILIVGADPATAVASVAIGAVVVAAAAWLYRFGRGSVRASGS